MKSMNYRAERDRAVVKRLLFLTVVFCAFVRGEDAIVAQPENVALSLAIKNALKEGPITPVDAFNELRVRYSTKTVNAFLEYFKPRDVLACLCSLTEQLDHKPNVIERALWDSLMRVLEAHVQHLEKMYVVSEDEQVFVQKRAHRKSQTVLFPSLSGGKK